jgi:plasmid stabilization system protein ParE
MAKEVRWSKEALDSFNNVVAYLEENWTENEIISFAEATDSVVNYISLYPKMFRKTDKLNIHEALVTPHNLLIYKIYRKHIALITFWDTRQNPAKKKL